MQVPSYPRVRFGSRLDYNTGMEDTQYIAMTFSLLSGISVLLIAAGLSLRPAWLDSFFRAQGMEAARPREHRLICLSLLAAGSAWVLVFAIWMIPFPYARPLWVPALSSVLIPLAGLLAAAVLAWAILLRRFAGKKRPG